MNRKQALPALTGTLLATLLMLAAPAQALSADLLTWTRAGDVLIGALSTSASLSTAADASGELPLSGQSALLYFDLEPALGIAAGTLAADTYEGSGMSQSFVLAGPTTVSFDWVLASGDAFDAGFADRGFVVVDGSTLLPLGELSASAVGGSFSITFSVPGNHSLAIGLMDVNDTAGLTTLSISAFNVSAVPEPGSWALMLAGAVVLGAATRRRRS